MCGEWWAWEIVTILSGLLGPIQLAVHVIYVTILPLYYMIPLGIGLAGASRVGTLIGENRSRLARRLGNTTLWFTLCETLTLSSISFCFRRHIPRLFTSNPEVIEIAAALSPFYCLFVIPHGLQGSLLGVLRAIKRQGKSAIAVWIGPWLIGISLASSLAFSKRLNLQIFGLWIGNNSGYAVMDLILLYFWLSFQWDKGRDISDIVGKEQDVALKGGGINNVGMNANARNANGRNGDGMELKEQEREISEMETREIIRTSGSLKLSHYSAFVQYHNVRHRR